LTRFRPNLNWKRPLMRSSPNTEILRKRKNNEYGNTKNLSGGVSRR
jgi:hypothetical protein